MLSCTGKRSHRHTILHVSFSNSFGLASARPTPQGLSGAPNYRERIFSCKDQFLVMSYAQLTGRDSLRDIENCLMVLSNNLYYFGIIYAVPRNILAKANEKRDWHIYKDFAEVLLKRVRPLYAQNYFRLDLDNMVYAFDCSTISLCLELCPRLL